MSGAAVKMIGRWFRSEDGLYWVVENSFVRDVIYLLFESEFGQFAIGALSLHSCEAMIEGTKKNLAAWVHKINRTPEALSLTIMPAEFDADEHPFCVVSPSEEIMQAAAGRDQIFVTKDHSGYSVFTDKPHFGPLEWGYREGACLSTGHPTLSTEAAKSVVFREGLYSKYCVARLARTLSLFR